MRQLIFITMFLIGASAKAQVKSQGIKVAGQRFLATKDNTPFFWLGDTDWELFHRMTREEAETFLETRRQQGFNVIHAVALAEMNGIKSPNRYGDFPLVNDDPTRLATTPGSNPGSQNEYDYWDHVDFIIKTAADKGMYIGFLPTWGDKVTLLWGEGPTVFNAVNAEIYTSMLAKRYKNQWNIIWILGGDRPPVYSVKKDGKEVEQDDRPIWRAMAKGIEDILGKEAFITYHTWGNERRTSNDIHNENWLDLNTFQSGHGSRETPSWLWARQDLLYQPVKPTLDSEPCYEDHPVNPWDGKWNRERGYFSAYDVRARVYRSVFAGACGVTYGHHQIWQFLNKELYATINIGDTLIGWQKASDAPGAWQMQYLKKLMLSRPYFNRIEDSTLIKSSRGSTYKDVIIATRDEKGSYAMVYLPQNKAVTIDLSKISGQQKNIWWFNPEKGTSIPGNPVNEKGDQTFTPPSHRMDWILVIDDAAMNFKAPGK